MCDHVIYKGSLVCTRTDPHDPDADVNHTYAASWASDEHDRAEAES